MERCAPSYEPERSTQLHYWDIDIRFWDIFTPYHGRGLNLPQICVSLAFLDLKGLFMERENIPNGAGPVVVYSARANGDFGATFVSDNVRNQLGWEPTHFTENPSFWVENIHPEDRDTVLARFALLFENGSVVQKYRFRHSDGTYRRLWDEIWVVRDPQNGKAQELVGYMVDITVGSPQWDLH